MRSPVPILIAAVLAGGVLARSQTDGPAGPPPDGLHTGAAESLSNRELPSEVPVPAGKLSLFADFAHRDKDGVPLYVVNATDQPIIFEAEDEDIHLMLEHRQPDGRWQRAQPHVYSWCGNSYEPTALPPGRSFLRRGYLPADGERARVRYSSYGEGDLASNEGDGFVLARDIGDAQVDPMSRRVPRFLADALDPEVNRPSASPTPAEQVTALRLLSVYEDNVYYKRCAERLAGAWEAKPAAGEPEIRGAKALREILAAPWPPERNPAALRDRCVEALRHPVPDDGEAFGAPEANPTVAWRVLDGLAEIEFYHQSGGYWHRPVDLEAWKPVATLVAESFASADRGTKYCAANIAALNAFADGLLADEALAGGLNGDSWTARVCANTLARRKRWQRLAGLGWKLPVESQAIVVGALAHPAENVQLCGLPRNPELGIEEKFWQHCLENFPGEAIYEISLYEGAVDRHSTSPFNRAVHDWLHDSLAKEAARSSAQTEDFDLKDWEAKLAGAVGFLDTWNLDADTSLFLKLLSYRGYSIHGVSVADPSDPRTYRQVDKKVYDVRQRAKLALERRCIPVPDDLLLVADVPR